MDFINNINKETLIICNNSDKHLILNRNKLINIKVMNMNEFISKYCFSYDENAIIYIMNKYNIRYDIALMYIKNMYFIKNKKYNIKKLDFLVELKQELEDHNLLTYNNHFKTYLNNIDIIVYGIRLGKYELDLLKDINYKYITKEYKKYNHTINYFDTMEEELEFVATNICQLIDKGISINNIKLANVDSSYYNDIVRIFSLFGLKVNIPYSTNLASFPYIKNFIDLYQKFGLTEALNQIDKTHNLYDELISVINKYIKYNNDELIIYKLKRTTVNSYKYDNGIDLIDYLDYVSDDSEYVFMVGFNDGVIPNSYKDIDYITDNVKDLIHMDTTKEKNQYLREDILNNIYNIKNLIITYKLRDNKRTYYTSSLCNNFEVTKGNIDTTISYSDTYNKIKLVKSIDDYIKYGYKNNQFDSLYNNFEIHYNSFDNKYQKINRELNKLTLSYSKMQIYNKCAFRYYLTDILKLDIFEENFSVVIGSMVHYVLEKCLSNNDLNPDKYVEEYLGDKKFTNKEKFFLEKYKVCIKELLNQIILEKEYSSFDNAMYEKKIDIDYGNNIKFTGIIDKILYKEDNNKTYLSLIDYKTGHDDISLKYLKYGLNIQLPIYLYLSKQLGFKNPIYSGFYLQKFNITDKDYRLIGYSNNDRDTLSIMDNNYENSKIIKGMKTLKSGAFSSYTKTLSDQEIKEIQDIVEHKIEEVIENIKNNKFDINPKINEDKNIGCEYCKFRDICFVRKKDMIEIKEEEFGGETNGLD